MCTCLFLPYVRAPGPPTRGGAYFDPAGGCQAGRAYGGFPTDVQSDLHLVQSQDGKFEEVIKNTFEFKPLPDLAAVVEGGFPFDVRDNLTGMGKVYSSGQKIQALDCWLVAQNDAAGVRDRFISFAKTTYSLAGLFALVLVLFISGGWWWLVGRAGQYQ